MWFTLRHYIKIMSRDLKARYIQFDLEDQSQYSTTDSTLNGKLGKLHYAESSNHDNLQVWFHFSGKEMKTHLKKVTSDCFGLKQSVTALIVIS